jgi:hypothetical protein
MARPRATHATQSTLQDYFSSSPSRRPNANAPHVNSSAKASEQRLRVARNPLFASSSEEAEEEGEDKSDVGAIQFETETLIVSDEKETSPRAAKTKKPMRLARADSDEGNGNKRVSGDDSEGDRGVPVRWNPKGKGTRKRAQIADSNSEGELQPKRRKLIKGIRPSSPEDCDELDADSEAFLQVA